MFLLNTFWIENHKNFLKYLFFIFFGAAREILSPNKWFWAPLYLDLHNDAKHLMSLLTQMLDMESNSSRAHTNRIQPSDWNFAEFLHRFADFLFAIWMRHLRCVGSRIFVVIRIGIAENMLGMIDDMSDWMGISSKCLIDRCFTMEGLAAGGGCQDVSILP